MRSVEPVVVVGAGPAGMSAAIAMARAGVACRVVERRRDMSSLPRATVVSTRSMELLRSWGLEATVRAGGNDVEWRLWECETLARAAGGKGYEVGYPNGAQATMVSPTGPACVPQDHLERVMMDHLQSFPHVQIEFGTEVVAIRSDDRAVQLTLRDAAGGGQRIVRARYVVAADGAHSTVRELLGIAMQGDDRLHDSLVVQFRAPLWEIAGPHRYGIYSITDTDGAGTLLPAGDGNRWLFGIDCGAGHDPLADRDERLRQIIRAAAGQPDLDVRIERVDTFSFAAQLADRWREGRIFLAGDAAHRVTPRGGTGMNTAIAGGFDLGWKLAWVLNDWAQAALLDSYEFERRPIVTHNLDRSVDPAGSRRSVLPELQVDLGGRIPHAWLPTDESTVDLVTRGLTLLTAGSPRWSRAADSVDATMPLTLRELDAVTARTIGMFATGALLVRPDGVAIGLWQSDRDADRQLHDAVRVITGVARRGDERDAA